MELKHGRKWLARCTGRWKVKSNDVPWITTVLWCATRLFQAVWIDSMFFFFFFCFVFVCAVFFHCSFCRLLLFLFFFCLHQWGTHLNYTHTHIVSLDQMKNGASKNVLFFYVSAQSFFFSLSASVLFPHFNDLYCETFCFNAKCNCFDSWSIDISVGGYDTETNPRFI